MGRPICRPEHGPSRKAPRADTQVCPYAITAARSRPPPTGATLVVRSNGPMYLGHGFRQPNSETEFGASVMGIGPYALRGTRDGTPGRRALRVVAESRRDCPGERRTAERLRQRGRGMGGNRGRDYPKSVQQPRTIPQSACG